MSRSSDIFPDLGNVFTRGFILADDVVIPRVWAMRMGRGVSAIFERGLLAGRVQIFFDWERKDGDGED